MQIFGILNKTGKDDTSFQLSKMGKQVSVAFDAGIETKAFDHAGLGICYPKNEGKHNIHVLEIPDKGLAIVANARIFNRKELTLKLGLDINNGQPDSYFILQAFLKWGENCNQYLEGDFVYAIWDNFNQTLFVASDHIGSRTLFYFDSPDVFVFASQVRCIDAICGSQCTLNDNLLPKLILNRTISDETYLENVLRLTAGRFIEIVQNQFRVTKYWHLEPHGRYRFRHEKEWYDCIKEVVYNAIEDRIGDSENVGIFLSGGLDSSAIACILSEILKRKNKYLIAFSSVTDTVSKSVKDERAYIELVSNYCGNIIHHYENIDDDYSLSNIEKNIEILEHIPGNIHFMTSRMYSTAYKNNIQVMFSGYGGDQWLSFQGNRVPYELLRDQKIRQSLDLLKEIARFENSNLLSVVKRYILAATPLFEGFLKWKKGDRLPDMHYTRPHLRHKYPRMKFNSQGQKIMYRINSGEISYEVQFSDRFASYYNMYSALPFFDRRLMEVLADVPKELFIKGGYSRSLFRNCFAGIIPEEVRLRTTKTPFVPANHINIRSNMQVLDVVFQTIGSSDSYRAMLSEKKINQALARCTAATPEQSKKELLALAFLGLKIKAWEILKKRNISVFFSIFIFSCP